MISGGKKVRFYSTFLGVLELVASKFSIVLIFSLLFKTVIIPSEKGGGGDSTLSQVFGCALNYSEEDSC